MGTSFRSHLTQASGGVMEHLKMPSLPSFATILFSLLVNLTRRGAEIEYTVDL